MAAWWWVPAMDGDCGRDPVAVDWSPPGGGALVRMELDVMGLPPRWAGQRLVAVCKPADATVALLLEDIPEDGA